MAGSRAGAEGGTRDPTLLQERLSQICMLCWGEDKILPNADPKTCIAYWEVLKLRDLKDDLFKMVTTLQLSKLDGVWADKAFKDIHSTKAGWHLRWNQPDIFMFVV